MGEGNDSLLSRMWLSFDQEFDRVVIASGHYHTCRIPSIPGLAELKARWPNRVQHSKSYRNSRGFEGQVSGSIVVCAVIFLCFSG